MENEEFFKSKANREWLLREAFRSLIGRSCFGSLEDCAKNIESSDLSISLKERWLESYNEYKDHFGENK